MKDWIKIVLILLAIFPLWLTIAAMGRDLASIEAWRETLNTQLLDQTTAQRRIQILEIQPLSDELEKSNPSDRFEFGFLEERSQGLSTLEIRFFDSTDRLIRKIKVPSRLLIEEKVIVATRELSRGWKIQAEDLRVDWVDSALISSKPVASNEIIGKTLKTPVRGGSPLLTGQLDKSNMVRIGDRVRIVVLGNNLSVSGFGIAKQAGERGETIRILNPDSKREIYGTVTAEKQVEVRL